MTVITAQIAFFQTFLLLKDGFTYSLMTWKAPFTFRIRLVTGYFGWYIAFKYFWGLLCLYGLDSEREARNWVVEEREGHVA